MQYAIISYSVFPESSEPVWLCWHPDEFEDEQYTWEDEETFRSILRRHPDWAVQFCCSSEADAKLLADEIGILDEYQIVEI